MLRADHQANAIRAQLDKDRTYAFARLEVMTRNAIDNWSSGDLDVTVVCNVDIPIAAVNAHVRKMRADGFECTAKKARVWIPEFQEGIGRPGSIQEERILVRITKALPPPAAVASADETDLIE